MSEEGARCRRGRWLAASPSSRAASKSRPKRPTEVYPAKLEEIRRRHDEGIKKVEDHYPPRSPRSRKNTRKIGASSTSRTTQTKATTQEQYKQTWDKLIKDWTEGMARINGVVGEVRDEAERRFLDWTRPELDGWKPPTEVPPGHAFRRIRASTSTNSPTASPRDPTAQVGADPVRAAGPFAVSRFRARS